MTGALLAKNGAFRKKRALTRMSASCEMPIAPVMEHIIGPFSYNRPDYLRWPELSQDVFRRWR